MLNVLSSILSTPFEVTVESSAGLVADVQRAVQDRVNSLLQKGQSPPNIKQPVIFTPLQGSQQWTIRSIDLLRKIGELTTPTTINMAQLSSSWATRRYFWAIDASTPVAAGATAPFRLSTDARDLDFHQKTLLSDEFGIGMAGLLMETLLGAPNFVDISVALDDPGNYQNIIQNGSTQPDYLMWGNGTPYYVVECKGSQTRRSTSIDQLRRGLEQVPSVVMTQGHRTVETVVIATFLDGPATSVYVIDPPGDGGDNQDPDNKEEVDEKASKRTGQRSWFIKNPEIFEDRAWTGQEISILRWAGQHRTAEALSEKLKIHKKRTYDPTDLPVEKRETPSGDFIGISSPLLPGVNATVFTGVDAQLIDRIKSGQHDLARELFSQPRHSSANSAYQSFGPNGTCMIIAGLE